MKFGPDIHVSQKFPLVLLAGQSCPLNPVKYLNILDGLAQSWFTECNYFGDHLKSNVVTTTTHSNVPLMMIMTL